jgi:hypothetical protein
MTKPLKKDLLGGPFLFVEHPFGNELVTFQRQLNTEPAVQRVYIYNVP